MRFSTVGMVHLNMATSEGGGGVCVSLVGINLMRGYNQPIFITQLFWPNFFLQKDAHFMVQKEAQCSKTYEFFFRFLFVEKWSMEWNCLEN